jgi:general L-amino acid transport system permease protein
MSLNEKASHQVLPPPVPPGPVRWLQENLFGSIPNTIMTILAVTIIYFGAIVFWDWASTANWRPITEFPLLYLIGQYPRPQMWRVGLGLLIGVALLGISAGKWGGLIWQVALGAAGMFLVFALLPVDHPQLGLNMRLYLGGNILVLALGFLAGSRLKLSALWIGISWAVFPVIVAVLVAGFPGNDLLPVVATTSWGGLLVTFILAFGGILLSFPIGLLLALGRRSNLPVVKAFSTIYIETIRGVPLVSLLFMFSIILALFLPEDARLDRLLRALMAVTVFSSAYSAENIRGGLQSISPGQYEAANALGMSGFQTMTFIILPQAIRNVIPTIIGQFIALFKDTTLVVIVGINDLLGIGQSILGADPDFLLADAEVYLFIASIYWVFSYILSAAGRRIEAALGVGTR